MKCSSVLKLFSDYQEGTLNIDMACRFDEHISTCSDCRERFMVFNASMMMLDEIKQVEPPLGLRNEIIYCLSEEQKRAARPVKWWKIDWDQAFSVRSPLRAAGVGLVLLVMVVFAANLSPINTITAGLVSHEKTTTIYGVEDNKTLQAWGPWGTHFTKLNQTSRDAGVSISVSVESGKNEKDLYAIRLETRSADPVDFSIHQLPNDFTFSNYSANDNNTRPMYSGFVGKNKASVIRFQTDNSGLPLVTKISWDYKGRHNSEFVFLPPSFNKTASLKSAKIFMQGDSVYNALKKISTKYGVVVLADGYLGKVANSVNASVNTPNEAFYKTIDPSSFKWSTVDQHVYKVESTL